MQAPQADLIAALAGVDGAVGGVELLEAKGTCRDFVLVVIHVSRGGRGRHGEGKGGAGALGGRKAEGRAGQAAERGAGPAGADSSRTRRQARRKAPGAREGSRRARRSGRGREDSRALERARPWTGRDGGCDAQQQVAPSATARAGPDWPRHCCVAAQCSSGQPDRTRSAPLGRLPFLARLISGNSRRPVVIGPGPLHCGLPHRQSSTLRSLLAEQPLDVSRQIDVWRLCWIYVDVRVSCAGRSVHQICKISPNFYPRVDLPDSVHFASTRSIAVKNNASERQYARLSSQHGLPTLMICLFSTASCEADP